MLHETYPNEDMTVLVDYYGREISDSLEVAKHFSDMANAGKLSFRLDTHGGRYLEDMDLQSSYAVLDRCAPNAIRSYRTEAELRHLVGTGVTAASIWRLREALNEAGFPNTKIVASSGFNVEKCQTMAIAEAPVDVVGTGSYLPDQWSETYATADIIEYNGKASVKVGREFLLAKSRAGRAGKK
jgi:nicotinate phosphoribosyltransferase